MIRKILSAMQDVIAQHGLELLQRYPNDLLIIDREIIEKNLVAGAKLAWMVGHSHTHLSVLGIHPRENECVGYHLNLSADDRFYLLSIGQDRFTLSEKSRDAYAALERSTVPYAKEGCDSSSFWVVRNKVRIGHISLVSIGSWQQPEEQVLITPMAGIGQQDRTALEMWAAYGVREKARTLFVRSIVTWQEPFSLRLVA